MQTIVKDLFGNLQQTSYTIHSLSSPILFGSEWSAIGFTTKKEYNRICVIEKEGWYYVALVPKYSRSVEKAVLIGAAYDNETLEAMTTEKGLSKLMERANSGNIQGEEMISETKRKNIEDSIFSALLNIYN